MDKRDDDDPLPTARSILAWRPVWPQSLAFGDPFGLRGLTPARPPGKWQ
jgi:hypothetical protein